ncbi:MAG: hypothetical protein D6696_06265 [Acidobacteria bacterium]|nr:MAG: hypothetical protein D6696_06265 [Acidobacteriota bacterium]
MAHALSVVALSFALACASSAPLPPPAPLPAAGEIFLVDPMEGYPLTAAEDLSERLRWGFRELLAGDLEGAAAVAEALRGRDPGFHPASVLAAQVALVEKRAAEAQHLLERVVDELPGYVAAQLVLGHAAEIRGEVLAAFDAYRAVAAAHPAAAERAAELRPRALDVLANRFDDALARGRLEDAAAALARLEAWAPEDRRTLESAWRLAAARGDRAAERSVLERLASREPERREVLERLAELDLEEGRFQLGIARLEALVERYPADRELAGLLERAKFLWRLENLPPAVRQLADAPQLSRAELATLLYWLVPEVRVVTVDNPPIATDIIDHPRHDEIVRVVSLGLLEVDETVHRFAPDRPVTRAQVLAALLTLLVRSGEPLACLEGVRDLDLRSSRSLTCRTAARCGLLEEEGDCLPAAPVSGAEALELFRALDHLSAS